MTDVKKIGDPDVPISPEEQRQRLLGYLDLIVRDDPKRYARVVANMREADLYASDKEAYQAWLAKMAECTEEQIRDVIDDPEDEVTVIVNYETRTLPDDIDVQDVDAWIGEIADRHGAEWVGAGTWLLDATYPRDCQFTLSGAQAAGAFMDEVYALLEDRDVRGWISSTLED